MSLAAGQLWLAADFLTVPTQEIALLGDTQQAAFQAMSEVTGPVIATTQVSAVTAIGALLGNDHL